MPHKFFENQVMLAHHDDISLSFREELCLWIHKVQSKLDRTVISILLSAVFFRRFTLTQISTYSSLHHLDHASY